MKKIIALCTVVALGFSGAALAQPHFGNGYGHNNGQYHNRQYNCQDGNFRGHNMAQNHRGNGYHMNDYRNNDGRGGYVGGYQSQQGAESGGFTGAKMEVSTVEQAKQMSDDQKVALRGNIIQSLGGEDYLFKDETGTINVEIDHKRWRGQVVTPSDLIEIQGEVDKDWKSIEIDVKYIIKVNADKE